MAEGSTLTAFGPLAPFAASPLWPFSTYVELWARGQGGVKGKDAARVYGRHGKSSQVPLSP